MQILVDGSHLLQNPCESSIVLVKPRDELTVARHELTLTGLEFSQIVSDCGAVIPCWKVWELRDFSFDRAEGVAHEPQIWQLFFLAR